MVAKLKQEDILSFIDKSGFVLLDNNFQYNGCWDEISIEDSSGYKYQFKVHDFQRAVNERNKGLSIVHKNNPYSLDNIKLWIIKNYNDKYSFESGVFISAKIKSLILKCKQCKHTWDTTWEYVRFGHLCPFCSNERTAIEESFGALFPNI